MRPPSLRTRIAEMLYHDPHAIPRTAVQIQKYLAANGSKPLLSSLSSLLRKMVDEGLILRVEKFGPRGGYGYMKNFDRRDDLREAAGIPKPPPPVIYNNPIADRYLEHAGWSHRDDK
jgi:hypothetical protein